MTTEIERSEVERGLAFAEILHGLVAIHGPTDFSFAEKEALASHLVSTAVEWVRARNRAQATHV
jgi:hypothetical protein